MLFKILEIFFQIFLKSLTFMTVKISIMKRFKFLKISEIGVAFDRMWLIIGDVSQDFVNLRTFHVNG